MKTSKWILLAALLAIMVSPSVFAQLTDGDTVYVVPVKDEVAPWDTVKIPVNISSNSFLGGLSLGFRPMKNGVPTTDLKPVRIETTGSILAAVPGSSFPAPSIDAGLNAILVGWVCFVPTSFPNSPKGEMFKIVCSVENAGAPAGSVYSLDTVFVPPAGFPRVTIGPTNTSTTDTPAPFDPRDGQHVRLPAHENEGPVLPTVFELSQNNPNPFNPSTTINFALPKSANVKIEVFNILGQKVNTLVDEFLSAGRKRVEWNGTDNAGRAVASGVYLYKMTAGDFTATKKMMLMK